jgi:hypothetical protein
LRVATKNSFSNSATSPEKAWKKPAMTIMMPANRMKPTAQVLVGFARLADRYCGAACSDTADPSSSGLTGQPVIPAAAIAPSGQPSQARRRAGITRHG